MINRLEEFGGIFLGLFPGGKLLSRSGKLGELAEQVLQFFRRGGSGATKRAIMPPGKSQLDHIFDLKKVDDGHIAPKTAGSRSRAGRMFENVASDPMNSRPDLVTDLNKRKAGIEVFRKKQHKGTIWVETVNGVIQDAGVNR